MEWIKASDRLPSGSTMVYLKGYRRLDKGFVRIEFNTLQNKNFISIYEQYEKLSSYEEGHTELKNIYWLDESTPSPSRGFTVEEMGIAWQSGYESGLENEPNNAHAYISSLPQAGKVEGETGVELIAKERERQVSVEKFDYEHDSTYKNGELIGAAASYVASALNKDRKKPFARFQVYREAELDFMVNTGDRGDRQLQKSGWVDGWPWSSEWDKRAKHDKLRSLVIAGALIAAQIDKEIKPAPPKQ